MKTELAIQKLLRDKGLEYTKEYLNVTAKEAGDLILLKYKQIEADWTKPELHQCRGIILHKDTFDVVAFSYEKFFNLSEGYAATIDWDSAKFYEKLDGSLINLYFYNDSWHVQTSGTIDANADTYHPSMTFADLFWYTVIKQYGSKENFISKLDTNNNYMFELMSPYNIIVTQHTECQALLHGARDMTTYNFIDIDNIDLDKAKLYDLSSVDEMMGEIGNMGWQEEGFVVVDKNFNRVKCKNPDYVAVHHQATSVKPSSIINIIKTNEIDEFLSYFKHRKDEVLYYEKCWNKEQKDIEDFYNTVKDIEDQKEFAVKVLNGISKQYSGILFALRNGHIKDVHEGMCRISDKDWYYKFNYTEKTMF